MPGPDVTRVLELCRQGNATDALRVAFAANDTVGMLVVSIYDSADLSRLVLLLDSDPSVATEVVLAGVATNSDTDSISDLAYLAIADHSAELPLTAPQVEALCTRLNGDAESPLADGHAAQILEWIVHHHPAEALGFARTYADAAAPVGSLDGLATSVVVLLGASSSVGDREALLSYAGRCVQGGNFGVHDHILRHLTTIADPDVIVLSEQLPPYVAHNQPAGTGLQGILQRLTVDQIATLAGALVSPPSAAWFTAQVLPHLFTVHVAQVVNAADAPWWPQGALDWLFTQAAWAPDQARLLPTLLKVAHRGGDPSRVSQAQRLITEATQAAPADHPVKADMPRLGARTLLAEALGGHLDTAAPELRGALVHLDRSLRIAEYQAANWKRPQSAARLAAVIAAVDVVDAADIANQLGALSPTARVAFLETIALDLTPTIAASLAEAFRDDPQALTAMVAAAPGADALLTLWTDDPHLPYFRALDGTMHTTARLDPVPGLVRDYPNLLSAADRAELLAALDPTDTRYQLLVAIVGDWVGHPRPDDATLQSVVTMAGEHLADGADPDPLVQASDSLTSAPTAVRQALYAALGRAKPSPVLVDFLTERRAGEPPVGRPSVGAAIEAATAELVTDAATDDPREAVAALTLLDRLNPVAAVEPARRLAREAPLPADRITAIRILGQHGTQDPDADSLVTLLGDIADGDNADGDQKVRREAHRALRFLQIGDLAAAHERLGELAGTDADAWTDHDPTALYGDFGGALREGLDRLARAESHDNWAEGINQLDEVGKVLVFRALETAGRSDTRLDGLVKQVARRDYSKWGSIVVAQALTTTWPWVAHFAANHTKRTAHIVAQGGTNPPPKRLQADFETALVNFRDGAKPCLDLIAAHTSGSGSTQH
jgi:hypothetical protein